TQFGSSINRSKHESKRSLYDSAASESLTMKHAPSSRNQEARVDDAALAVRSAGPDRREQVEGAIDQADRDKHRRNRSGHLPVMAIHRPWEGRETKEEKRRSQRKSRCGTVASVIPQQPS